MPSESIYLKLEDVSFIHWVVVKVETDTATWAMLTFDSRQAIRKAIQNLRTEFAQLRRFAGATLEVTAAKVRSLLALLEKLTSAVHSARKVMTEDRRRALGLISQAKKRLHAYIQLNLFGGRESQ